MIEVADIFRRFADAYLAAHGAAVLPSHRRAIADIIACHTEALGGHLWRCNHCSHEVHSYHSCKNRSCPKCHTRASMVHLHRDSTKRVKGLSSLKIGTAPTATWQVRIGAAPLLMTAEANAMHGMLMRRPDALAGCPEGSNEEAKLTATVDAIEAYEIKRWPIGREPGGKG